MIGQTIKHRYRIYDRLGMGGAATVYLARDIETGRVVIVKVVHTHLVNEQFIRRFEREIELLRVIDSPHVIKLFDYGLRELDTESNQMLSYIVAEFVEGHTLADIIDTRAPLPEKDALAIVRQLALGLGEVHKHDIVHRDVKSQNVMLTPDNQAKIIDFGIAKAANHATLTDPSHFAGTLYYAPPEQILETANVDLRADVYALGIVLYEMLTGRLPVRERDFGTVATKIISGDLDPITGVSEPVENLVGDMIAHDVNDRIASMQEVVSRIEAITGEKKGPNLKDRPPTGTMAVVKAARPETPEFHIPPCELVTVSGHAIRLTRPVTVIGRSHPRDPAVPDVDLWEMGVEDVRTASRRHCRILYENGGYFIEDLGSMNGTFVNNQQLVAGEVHPLQDGDEIIAGRVQLTFRLA